MCSLDLFVSCVSGLTSPTRFWAFSNYPIVPNTINLKYTRHVISKNFLRYNYFYETNDVLTWTLFNVAIFCNDGISRAIFPTVGCFYYFVPCNVFYTSSTCFWAVASFPFIPFAIDLVRNRKGSYSQSLSYLYVFDSFCDTLVEKESYTWAKIHVARFCIGWSTTARSTISFSNFFVS